MSTCVILHTECMHAHTKGSCKKRALQAGQDRTHFARNRKIFARFCKIVAIYLARLQDYESCKHLACTRFLQDVSDLGRPEVHVSCKSLLYGHVVVYPSIENHYGNYKKLQPPPVAWHCK